ncbi:MAG: hypothetical protein PUH25_04605 [Spirochaetales bacterium]|uniref:hypothetical protein n=1 Tax=Bullifex sp. TaxID=2815808 RepID=UPI002A56721C|nr:hypothetical protein [Bullifex sp.]MDD5974032.1 hypothetical protein [Spirochaetales bacterium]MDD7271145.1 hypothetical protein [Spirochaetales bacterium]MDY4067235.1 hypothetical protein [Bullifex sp.]
MKRSKIVFRYLFTSSKKEKSRTIRIMVGLCFSTMVLLCVLSIMDHLQSGRFKYIKKIRSFPVTVKAESEIDIQALSDSLFDKAIVFAYKTGEGLLKVGNSEAAVNIRYITKDYEGGLVTSSKIGEGLLIPYRLYYSNKGSSVLLTTLEKGKVARFAPKTKEYTSFGLFQTSLGSEFDSSNIFLPFEDAPDNSPMYIAFIPFSISESEMENIATDLNIGRVITWKESEASLYGAMLIEKKVMSLLLMSLYIIIAVQVFQNACGFASLKKNELSALYLIGYTKNDIKLIATGVALLLSSISFAFGLLGAKIFLTAVPYFMPIFAKGTLKLDISAIPYVFIIFTLYCVIVYVWAFLRELKQKNLREVINTI